MDIKGTEFDRGDLAREIAKRTDMAVIDCLTVLKALPSVLVDALVAFEGRVEVSDLGTFKIKLRKERKGYNFQTGESVVIPQHNVVTFKPAPFVAELLAERTNINP